MKDFNEELSELGFSTIKSDKELDDIKDGLIHIHAKWSGPSIARTAQIVDLLRTIKLTTSVKKYYLDNDLISTPKYINFFNNHGYGETIVIKGGQIIYSTKFGQPTNELIGYLDKLK